MAASNELEHLVNVVNKNDFFLKQENGKKGATAG